MANKRNLKRAINLICDELLAECMAASLYRTKAHKDNADAILFSIVKMKDDFCSRISHQEPGMNANAYFKDIRDKFSAQVGEIVDQINNL